MESFRCRLEIGHLGKEPESTPENLRNRLALQENHHSSVTTYYATYPHRSVCHVSGHTDYTSVNAHISSLRHVHVFIDRESICYLYPCASVRHSWRRCSIWLPVRLKPLRRRHALANANIWPNGPLALIMKLDGAGTMYQQLSVPSAYRTVRGV